jgi:hypothetical protein
MSAKSNWVTWGMLLQAMLICRAVSLRTGLSGSPHHGPEFLEVR